MKKQLFLYPAPEEMRALDAAARRARARHMNVFFRRGIRALKSLAARFAVHFAAIPSAKRASRA